MKILKRLGLSFLFIIAVVFFVVPFAFAQAADTATSTQNYFVNANQLNVRSEPYMDTTGANVIGVLKYADNVTVENKLMVDTTQWCEIKYPNYAKAYVDCQYLSSAFVQKSVTVKAKVNADNLNVRSQVVREEDNVIGTLLKDAEVTVKNWRTDVKIPWCEIEYKDFERAFVVCSYLTIESSVVENAPVDQTPEPVIDVPNPGYYQNAKVLVPLNVRSTPEVPEIDQPSNVIGTLEKDDVVQVKSENIVTGLWCEIVYKEYAHAYVDCGYLEKM